MATIAEATKRFQDADDVWSYCLNAAFGKKAGDVRYTKAGEGKPGTVLNMAYQARQAAQKVFQAAWDAKLGQPSGAVFV